MHCLEVLSAMSSRWCLARNCHTVLSDLQHTLQENRDPVDNSSFEEPITAANSHFQPSIGNEVHRYLQHSADHAQSSRKRRRSDSGIQPSQPVTSYHANSQSRVSQSPREHEQLADSTSSSHLSLAAPLTQTLEGSASSTPSVLARGGRCNANSFLNRPRHSFDADAAQQSNYDAASISILPDQGGPDAMGVSMPALGDDSSWRADLAGPSNWDSGMPDIFAGATWESLLHAVDQDNLGWDGPFL